jgi:3-phosphoshikimate 1-carboxyvinyltransferase
MHIRINPHRFVNTVKVPASKSHTIRQLFIASLADGVSLIHNPLDSLDTRSCVSVCRGLGAEITEYCDSPDCNGEKLIKWEVRGNNGFKKNSILPAQCLDVGNSGTTLYFALAAAGLQAEPVEFTGDEQIKGRSAAPLLEALSGLGVQSQSNHGCVPVTINGPWEGGRVVLPCPTSQYLSALLIAAPLAPAGTLTEIVVPLLNERPYIDMTLSYLRAFNIPFHESTCFSVPGGSSWKAFSGTVPGDFSSAAFPAAAAAITGKPVTLLGLDPEDTQGDKYFLEILKSMGCRVTWQDGLSVTISREHLCGGTFDLNATPDLFPAAAAVAAFIPGDTAFVNITHTRIKETDRIAVMARELAKFGVKCTELPDGLVVHGKGALFPSPEIDGSGDHRVIMALAVAALGSPTPVIMRNTGNTDVSYPGFWELFK